VTTYIAGPMTGIPEFNYPAFNDMAARLRARGIRVANPAENTCQFENPTWQDWMRMGIQQLMECDEILLLPGWEASRGARLERQVAEAFGMKVTERQPGMYAGATLAEIEGMSKDG
jgi:hypothetical protein